MQRFGFLAVLMLLSSSASAGNAISFVVGGHRIHIEASSRCRATSCASVSVSGISRNRDRVDDDGRRGDAVGKSQPALPATAPSTPPVSAPLVVIPPPPPVQPATLAVPPAPPPPVVSPVEAVRPAPVIAPPVARVSREVEDEPDDTPLGDWQTESKGSVRIVRCGNALCGYVLNSSSNDRGEAVLINMKPNSATRWTGNVYSHASGDSYYGTLDMTGPNTLRIEACALGRFYCSGNKWSRIVVRPESLMSSRQSVAEPRS